MSIKGTGQTLFVGKEKITIREFWEKDEQFIYSDVQSIEYQFADNSCHGFMRFKLSDGNAQIFIFSKKSNAPMSRAYEFIKDRHPEIPIVESIQKFGIQEIYQCWSLKKRMLPVLISAIFLIACFAYSSSILLNIRTPDQRITLSKYNDCKFGMSYSDCVRIIGEEGEPVAETNILDTSASVYIWYANGVSGANATMQFTNDILYSKAQFGLK